MKKISFKRYGLMMFIAVILYAVFPAGLGLSAEPLAEKLGIEGGYFVCPTPEGWSRVDNDPDYGDERTYLISFNGPAAEEVPVLIYISYYGDGNDDFDGYEDFVNRNTTDIFDEVIAVAEKAELNGKDALTFEHERKQYLHPGSKDDTWVMVKTKFYVLLGKDRKGFFVLEYSAPSSAYEEYLLIFQGIADTFKIVE
ncbi:MAG: hypothetical protein ABIG55_05005 [Candidatus Omnitrophota bacterium]|nr:hypothetical protein [Candidatus Omnitrophota bacterium]